MLSKTQVLARMREKVHHPATVRELLRVLRIPRHERVGFKRLLNGLVGDGELIETRGHRFGLPENMSLVVGRLETRAGGFGFVLPERPADLDGDLFIPSGGLGEAMHGDRVVARIERLKEGGRAEGRIIRILERGLAHIVGRYERDGNGLGFVVPFDRRILLDVQIPAGEEGGARPGEMVAVSLTSFPTPGRGAAGRVSEVLGDIDAPGVDTRIIIRKHGLPDAHGQAAIDEALELGTAVAGAAVRERTDFRTVLTVTIDGEHARDFDDAISIERLPNGHYWLGVHIADVSHYVEEGSALDAEAYERGTSVYFPERAVHMFPAELATGLCSLNPRVDRLVQSCLMEVDRRGEVLRAEFHDGVINSRERMTYTDVNAILTDPDSEAARRYEPLVPTFRLMEELFHVLHERRRRRGSIDFDLNEAAVILDEGGLVEAIIALERNVAHRLIEEFMLLANETVAAYLEDQGIPSLYRIHEEPDPLKVEKFEAFLSGFGYSLAAPPGAVRPRHFQRLLDKIHDKPEEKPIAALMLRTMQKARYATQNVGHFGLAAESYTHFTSPIRRYPDLVVHRLLRAVRHGRVTADQREALEDDLPETARHTSEMERRAEDAERELVQWKKVRFMADKVGDEFEGFVTGVAAFGLFVELVEHFVEGLVHISSMADDYYRYDETAHALRGENTQQVYRLGDRVRVQVVRVGLEERQIDLGLVDVLERVRRDERARGPRRSKARPKRDGRSRRPGRRERQTRKKGPRR
ncbi:MAG TPA: ribonuclease R [Vicinamibacterales bacterium]|nr:ribonuclease R [Vicinamibacterales bacterium]